MKTFLVVMGLVVLSSKAEAQTRSQCAAAEVVWDHLDQSGVVFGPLSNRSYAPIILSFDDHNRTFFSVLVSPYWFSISPGIRHGYELAILYHVRCRHPEVDITGGYAMSFLGTFVRAGVVRVVSEGHGRQLAQIEERIVNTSPSAY